MVFNVFDKLINLEVSLVSITFLSILIEEGEIGLALRNEACDLGKVGNLSI